MRLSDQEISGIISAIEAFSVPKQAELRLYGSRADNAKKGGDIDLLLILPTAVQKNQFLEIKHKILNQIKEYIGEQKIDLLICEKNEVALDAFINIILPDSVVLKKW